MENNIKDWLYSIILFVLFTSVLFQMCAAKKYEKYVRFFAGIILVILVVSPVSKGLFSENILEKNYLSECLRQAAIDASDERESLYELQNENISNSYKKQIQISVESILSSFGYELVYADITLQSDKEKNNYFYPEYISAQIKSGLYKEGGVREVIINEIKLEEKEEEIDAAVIDIQKTIAEFFSMKEECVKIEIV